LASAATVTEIEDSLMSPGCNYKFTLTNCPSSFAEEMRAEIRRRVAAGETKEGIISYFVDQYGERVLAAPPKKGFNLLGWTLPFIGLGLGIGAVSLVIYSWTRRGRGATGPATETSAPTIEHDEVYAKRLEKEIEEYEG
jgi:cytochrome c-type biogenesis protein CcmH